MSLKVLTVFGTRPEAIKMAPIVLGLQKDNRFESKLCVTGQHREMLDQVLQLFDIKADFDLDIMKPGQDLYDVTSRVLLGIRDILDENSFDLILVHGDTTTCFAAGLAAFYHNTPIGHIEAGLRTGNLKAPFPEEANRVLVGRLANLHFAPTQSAKKNLLSESVQDSDIVVTGNTVIDALHIIRNKLPDIATQNWIDLLGLDLYSSIIDSQRKTILITGHRRESFGHGFIDLCNAVLELATRYPNWNFVYPVHLNPNVQKPVNDILGSVPNINLIEPVSYETIVWLMINSDLILTDSGGIQEEAPSLGKPVLVTRSVTERPEAVEAGVVELVGTNTETIVSAIERLLLDDNEYAKMANAINPYGDGQAVPRVLEFIYFKLSNSIQENALV
ncbi:MAG: UDP-N-acetylglucosamine 2-epimerase (non-hydrolyzing) [Gammaproteobacteria bacterium]|nr:UDP-N-acetylglucosamine 2-epimerase (non-hydrolyzing) [Gammaproteobacteria bacterium]